MSTLILIAVGLAGLIVPMGRSFVVRCFLIILVFLAAYGAGALEHATHPFIRADLLMWVRLVLFCFDGGMVISLMLAFHRT